jgi:hypothetical protein
LGGIGCRSLQLSLVCKEEPGKSEIFPVPKVVAPTLSSFPSFGTGFGASLSFWQTFRIMAVMAVPLLFLISPEDLKPESTL